MESLFIHYLTLWRPLGYSIVFLGVMFEGDLFVLLTASLVRLGYFDPFDMFFILFSGAVIGDLGWFYLGHRARASSTRITQWLTRHVQKLSIDSERNFFPKLVLSKFMYGTHRPFLFTLGMKNMTIGRFIIPELGAVLIWLTTIGGLGYGLGYLLESTKHIIKYAEIGIAIVVIVYIIIIRSVNRYQKEHHVLEE